MHPFFSLLADGGNQKYSCGGNGRFGGRGGGSFFRLVEGSQGCICSCCLASVLGVCSRKRQNEENGPSGALELRAPCVVPSPTPILHQARRCTIMRGGYQPLSDTKDSGPPTSSRVPAIFIYSPEAEQEFFERKLPNLPPVTTS